MNRLGRALMGSGCACSPQGSGATSGGEGWPRWRDPGTLEPSRYESPLYGVLPAPEIEVHYVLARAVAESIRAYLWEYPNTAIERSEWWKPVVDFYEAANSYKRHIEGLRAKGYRVVQGSRQHDQLSTAARQIAEAKRVADALMSGHNDWNREQLKQVQREAANAGADGFLEAWEPWFRDRLLIVKEAAGETVEYLAEKVGDAAGGIIDKTMPWGPLIAVGGVAVALVWLLR